MNFPTDALTTVLISLLTAVVSFLWYLGAFIKIKFEEETIGPFKFVYRNARGPYQGVGPMFEETINFFKKLGIKDCRTAGIYYDNPETEPNPKYSIGFIVETKEQEERFKSEEESILKEYKVMEVKETKTVSSHFPIKFQAMSCILSAMKTYPAFKRQDKYEGKTGCLEIYTDDDVGTFFPQDNLMQFWPKFS